MKENRKSLVEQFITYLYEKRRMNFYFLITMIVSNVIAVNKEEYAFNLLSFFIILLWGIILTADMCNDKDTRS